jgi:hypothetical protein
MNEALIKGGYILLAKNTINSAIWKKPPLYLKIWNYLLMKAYHKDFNGLKRGQLYTSIPEIIKDCCWYVGYRKVYPTKDQVFQIIKWLRNPCQDEITAYEKATNTHTKATMIATTKATQGIVINIDNYDFYQDFKNYEGNNGTMTKATRKQRQPDNIKNEVNNEINELKEDNTKEIYKEKFLEFVYLTQDEYEKLIAQYSEPVIKEIITRLNNYIGSTGAKYKSHYYTLLNWLRKEKKPLLDNPVSWDKMKSWAEKRRENDK